MCLRVCIRPQGNGIPIRILNPYTESSLRTTQIVIWVCRSLSIAFNSSFKFTTVWLTFVVTRQCVCVCTFTLDGRSTRVSPGAKVHHTSRFSLPCSSVDVIFLVSHVLGFTPALLHPQCFLFEKPFCLSIISAGLYICLKRMVFVPYRPVYARRSHQISRAINGSGVRVIA